jgi:hypothetical protein
VDDYREPRPKSRQNCRQGHQSLHHHHEDPDRASAGISVKQLAMIKLLYTGQRSPREPRALLIQNGRNSFLSCVARRGNLLLSPDPFQWLFRSHKKLMTRLPPHSRGEGQPVSNLGILLIVLLGVNQRDAGASLHGVSRGVNRHEPGACIYAIFMRSRKRS